MKRVTIRLKHSLPADTEIKDVLPDTVEEVEEAAHGPHGEGEVSPPDAARDDDHL